MYVEISRIAASATNILLLLGMYHQTWKMWASHEVNDLSGPLVIILLVDTIVWLNYGYVIDEWPIKLMGWVGAPAAIGMTLGYFKFQRSKWDIKTTRLEEAFLATIVVLWMIWHTAKALAWCLMSLLFHKIMFTVSHFNQRRIEKW